MAIFPSDRLRRYNGKAAEWGRALLRFIQRQPVLAVTLLLCLCGIAGFVEIAEDVLEGESHDIDRAIILLLRDPGDSANPWGPRWLQEMMRDFTGLGGTAVLTLITVLAVVFLLLSGKRGLSLYLSAAVISGAVMSNLLKLGFDRPRPDLVPHGSFTYTSSFPSGHAFIGAVVYLTLGAMLAETQDRRSVRALILAAAALITLAVGSSRVYLGVHWPSDVVAGWLGGGAWAFLFWVMARMLRRYGAPIET